MTPAEKEAALAALTIATDSLAEARASIDRASMAVTVARQNVETWQPDDGSEPDQLTPADLVCKGKPLAVEASWSTPAGAEALSASLTWVADDTRGQQSVSPGVTTEVVAPADPSRDYQVSVAYLLADGSVGPPATGEARPLPAALPDEWPADGTWPQRIAWIDARAGAKQRPRKTVGTDTWKWSNGTTAKCPEGTEWTGTNLYVRTATLLEDLVVPGTITPRGTSGPDIVVRNVVGQDCFTWERPRIKLVEDCTFEMPAAKVASGWGQGALNAMAPGFTVRRTLLTGSVDGMQCSGGGTVEDTVIRALGFHATSHNDFIQNYGGLVTMRRCHFEQNGAPPNHLNGLFCDSGFYDVADCALLVTAEPGTNAWVLHAAKAGGISIRDSIVRGRTIGAIKYGANVDIAAGY